MFAIVMPVIIWIQVGFAVLIFIVTLACVLLPLRLATSVTAGRQRLLSLANCLSAGIFLGTCNLQLRPALEIQVRQLLASRGGDQTQSGRLAEVTILLGILLVMLTEQVVHALQKPHLHHYDPLSACMDDDNCNETSVTRTTNVDVPTEQIEVVCMNESKHEHGHSHDSGGHSHITEVLHLSQTESGIRCVLLVTAMGMHSLLEGVAMGLQDSIPPLLSLSIGILAHEVFVMIAVGISMGSQGAALRTLVIIAVGLCAMIPIGVCVGMILSLLRHHPGGFLVALVAKGLATGTFVYVVFLEILPPELSVPTDRLLKTASLALGATLMGCLAFFLSQYA